MEHGAGVPSNSDGLEPIPEGGRRVAPVRPAWLGPVHRRWAALTARHPCLGWLERWGISAGSVTLGVVTLLVFRRGIEYFPWFVGYLIVLWLAGVVFAEVRQSLLARGRRLIAMVVDYTVQTLLHGLLLFLLPIYYASTTLTSVNVCFLILLAGAALLTAIDPWYRAIIVRFRGAEILLFGLGLFASLNAAVPLLEVQSASAPVLSGIVSLLALAPIFRGGPDPSWRGTLLGAGIWGMLVVLLLGPLRTWIPPVPLHLTTATFARSVIEFEPSRPVSRVSAGELKRWGEVVAFTAVAAPAGLREPIYHVWRRNGVVVDRIPLSPVRGGRPGGFRTYSRKIGLGQHPEGSWTVDVVTANDQLIGRIRLAVTP